MTTLDLSFPGANIQLKDLPDNTLIESKEHGVFLKGVNAWAEIFPHCADCMENVHEDGAEETTRYQPGFTTDQKAQDYLAPFTILAWPPLYKHNE